MVIKLHDINSGDPSIEKRNKCTFILKDMKNRYNIFKKNGKWRCNQQGIPNESTFELSILVFYQYSY